MGKKSNRKFDFLFKYVILGDTGVGKSALLERFLEERTSTGALEEGGSLSTLGIDFKVRTLTLEGKILKLQIWDVDNTDSLRENIPVLKSILRRTQGVFLVYDMSRRSSFDGLKKWTDILSTFGEDSPDMKTILVANKCDLKPEVSKTEGESFAEKEGFLFAETSSKQFFNVYTAFLKLSEKVLQVEMPKYEMVPYNLKQQKKHESSRYKLKKFGRNIVESFNSCKNSCLKGNSDLYNKIV